MTASPWELPPGPAAPFAFHLALRIRTLFGADAVTAILFLSLLLATKCTDRLVIHGKAGSLMRSTTYSITLNPMLLDRSVAMPGT